MWPISFATLLMSDLSLQDLGDLRQLSTFYRDSLLCKYQGFDDEVAEILDEVLEAVVQDTMSWARQHEVNGRYRDAEYFFRRVSSNKNIPMENSDLYQSEDVLPRLVSTYERVGDSPAAEMTQETLLRQLFKKSPKTITEEQTRAVYTYSKLLSDFQERVLSLSFGFPTSVNRYMDLIIAYRVALLDISLLNAVSLQQGLIALEFNKDDNFTLLDIAVKENAINLARLLIEKGANINNRNINSRDFESCTPLHIAAEYAEPSMIELLLANFADVEAVDEDGRTPLHVALIWERTLPIVATLINAKADMEARDDLGRTALMIAVDRDLSAAALLLLEQGANVEASDVSGETLLFTAVRYKQEWAVELLLENGADLVGKDAQGDTALYVAVARAQKSIIRVLLDHDREIKTAVDQKNNLADTVLHCAVRSANISILNMLLRAGADIHAEDFWGNTALHQAVIENREPHEHIVRLLLTHSASLDAVNHAGDTVLHLAVSYKRRSIIPILLQHVEPGKLPITCNMRNSKGKTPLDLARSLAGNANEYSNERSVLYLLENALELSHSFMNKIN